ncbi:MAG: NUDIX hydrolase [Lachnospiraceae bacterium]|nr:NUDIX hydrolase [Lachnospiraceae bacterium]
MLAKNKSGWILLEHLDIKEEEIGNYENVTGAFAIVTVDGQYLIGYNKWRQQWEFCGGGIEQGETAREAALRELFEETHQRAAELTFKGISRMQRPSGELCYQAVFTGAVEGLEPFIATEEDEMSNIMLWDLKQDIGYVDECDLKIVEMVCKGGK